MVFFLVLVAMPTAVSYARLLAQNRQTLISQIEKSESTPISQAPAAEIWLSIRKAREGDGAATGE